MGNGFSESLNTIFNKMEDFVSTKTVVGDAVTIGDVVLLPLIEVTVGMGAGATETPGKDGDKGVGGMGARIIPTAVLAIHNGNVQLINIKNQDAINKLIDMAPGVASKLNFSSIFNKNKLNDETEKPKEEVKFEETVIVEE